MPELSDLERQNYDRQSEIIHVTLGYHEARLRSGHPFALGNDVDEMNIKQAQNGALALHRALQDTPRIPLDLEVPSSVASPIERIRNGVLASVWDSFNHVYGLLDQSIDQTLHPFFLDEELAELCDASNQAGDRMRQEEPYTVHRYTGAHSIHSGFRVGINTLVSLMAIQEALPERHPFDALSVARIVAKLNESGLSIATSELNAAFPSYPHLVKSFLDEEGRMGIAPEKLQAYLAQKDFGCPALRPMGDVSRSILQRHDLYYPELDGPPAIKILGTKIRTYVRACLNDLRMKMDFHDSARLPTFDRHVVDRTLLSAAVPRTKKT